MASREHQDLSETPPFLLRLPLELHLHIYAFALSLPETPQFHVTPRAGKKGSGVEAGDWIQQQQHQQHQHQQQDDPELTPLTNLTAAALRTSEEAHADANASLAF